MVFAIPFESFEKVSSKLSILKTEFYDNSIDCCATTNQLGG
ncbi:hypothetical protein S7335_3314 [Synechococcus sp. PCC 7335]|nr:hypothetical protein S7335_3314 [Synechococcus sp. PCC 7335]